MQELRSSALGESDLPELRARFDADGYLLFRGVVDAGRAEALAEQISAVLDDLGVAVGDDAALEVFRDAQDEFNAAVQRLELFHALSYDPGLLEVVTAVCGEVFVLPRRLCRVILPGIEEFVTPPHQDFAYVGGSDRTVTAWLPLRDCSVEDGSLRVLVGSHHRGLLPGKAGTPLVMFRVEVDEHDAAWASADFQAGDVLLFHPMTVHAGNSNRSDRTRLSTDYRYQSPLDPVAARSLTPNGHPRVPDWPELLAGETWDAQRWLSVPPNLNVV